MTQPGDAARTGEALDADAELVAQACLGDQSAFTALVARHQRRIRWMLARYVGNADDADELAQETFLAAYRALPGFRGQSRFRTWLYTIAINQARAFLTARGKNTLLSLDDTPVQDDAEAGTFALPDTLKHHDTPESLLASKQVAHALAVALQELDDQYREVIMLRELDGLSYQDIGEMLGIPPGTVRSRLFRARERVAERLRPMLATSPGAKRW